MLALLPSPERRSYSPAKPPLPPPPPPPPFITLYLGAPLPGVDVDDLVALSTNCVRLALSPFFFSFLPV